VPEMLPPVPAEDLPTNVSNETRTNRKKDATRRDERDEEGRVLRTYEDTKAAI
jgi:hypothetical protein